MKRFESCHDDLERIFQLHQVAVLQFRFSAAATVLDCYRRMMLLHIRHEDDILLKMLDSVPSKMGWPTKIYYAEHRKLESLLAKIDSMMSRLPHSTADLRVAVLAFLEYQSHFKNLTQHHHEREHKGLFVEVAAIREGEDHRVEAALAEWRREMDVIQPQLAAITDSLNLAWDTMTEILSGDFTGH